MTIRGDLNLRYDNSFTWADATPLHDSSNDNLYASCDIFKEQAYIYIAAQYDTLHNKPV